MKKGRHPIDGVVELPDGRWGAAYRRRLPSLGLMTTTWRCDFKTEEEARRWLRKQRRRYKAK